MKFKLDPKIEEGRILHGFYGSEPGNVWGAFLVNGPCGRLLRIISDDGIDAVSPELAGWEHVSVSTEKHPPNWQEMCWVKDHFWKDTETVLQFHPKKSEYVNLHPFCLHLWRNVGLDHPLPPRKLLA
jgi:hypothetical protein